MEEDAIQLGGNIELSGFSGIDGGSMIILKKMIGNYVKRMNNVTKDLEKLSLTIKTVHDNQFELHAKMVDKGNAVTSSVTERNMFICVDNALKKIMNNIDK